MYALDNDSGVQTMPEVKAKKFNHTEPRWFTEGGNGVAPSYPGADWFNIVQAELLNILTEANIEPDKAQLNQITLAIKEVVKNSVSKSVEGKANKTHKHPVSDITGLQEALDEAGKKGLPVGAVIGFPKEVSYSQGFLLANGSTFSESTYPDLYRTLGKNKTPNLQRSDVGMTSYFAVDNIPEGWLAFDSIRSVVTQRSYPELYQHLVDKYGSISNVPLAEDRFIRSAHGSLAVGQKQNDEIKAHTHKLISYYGRHNENAALYGEGFEFEPQTNRSTVDSWGDGTVDDNGWIKPTNTSKYATGGAETRPKAIAFKLCIKAKNSFDDVRFWVKAFGEVTNVGALDASRLAQELQGKADANHAHTTSQITDFTHATNQLINAAFSYQKIDKYKIRKYPDGTLILSGKIKNKRDSGTENVNPVIFPVSFINNDYEIFVSEVFRSNASGKGQYNWVFATPVDKSRANISTWYDGETMWQAIGRWK
ncbi:phage tail collar domain-containing protein [Canicola haemoglobinophilus]|uniref:Phage tail collar domain-containing protein n=1 Tax=Canicola haemoglobinophilus TaxID=733 RepID=A0AB38HC02_9PAST|nr:tail fiber protein [Canicola haemoglobinophilus]STO55374.1 phage tail collar domain-containing protein [Canicola haemoglobinophilus]STO69057.1 phage tail collar domain-containing protein [Canicola haemoglobinophilus]